MRGVRLVVAALALVLVLGACGGGDDESPAPGDGSPTPSPVPSGGSSSSERLSKKGTCEAVRTMHAKNAKLVKDMRAGSSSLDRSVAIGLEMQAQATLLAQSTEDAELRDLLGRWSRGQSAETKPLLQRAYGLCGLPAIPEPG